MNGELERVHDAIVVGGGFAGVVAARDIADAGYDVAVLEARTRLGGRTYYRPLEWANTSAEFGGTHVDLARQPRVCAEIDRYRITMRSGVGSGQHAFRTAVGGARSTGSLPVPFEEVAALEGALYHIISASRRIQLGTPIDLQDLGDLDVSWSEFMSLLALPPATAGYIDCWVSNLGGTDPERISALYMLCKVAAHDHSPWSMFAGLATRFACGTASLIDAITGQSTMQVRLASPVRRIDQRDHDATIVVTLSSGERLAAHAVVVATPLNVWRDIEFVPALSETKRRTALEGQASRTAKVFALADHVPRRLFGIAFGGVLRFAYEYDESPEGRIVSVWSDVDKLDPTSVTGVQRALREVCPRAKVHAVDSHDWVSDEHSKGAALTFRPGQMIRSHSALARSEGRLYFAGADVAIEWPGSIEGAIESGKAAAAEACTAIRAALAPAP